MGRIERNFDAATKTSHDLIIVGGGVYGIMLSLEASRRNLRTLLVERGDFGGATSTNSLRIVHGGLRYLQTLDLPRFRESVTERRWFLTNFPNMVRPLPCLMPLYGDGLRRPEIFRVALMMNDSFGRMTRGFPSRPTRELPKGGVIDAGSVRRIYPAADTQKLKGGAIWFDAIMPDPQRILVTILRKACSMGAAALNYVEAEGILKEGNSVRGITARDLESGRLCEFRSPAVVNAAGPWNEEVADRFTSSRPDLFRRSVAWNVLLDRKPASDHALAVKPDIPHGQTFFVVPWKGMMLAGTGHAPYEGEGNVPAPTEEQLAGFISDLNLSMPGLGASISEVLHVFSGFLPVTEKGGTTLTKREVLYEHGRNGGPEGLYSVTGIKFTTARLVAEKTLDMVSRNRAGGSGAAEGPGPDGIIEDESTMLGAFDPGGGSRTVDPSWRGALLRIAEEESVVHLDDLMLRRTSLGDHPAQAMGMAGDICGILGWGEERSRGEIARLKGCYRPQAL